MPFVGEWCKVCIYFGFVFAWTKAARPRFDTSTDMGLVLVPSDAEVDSVIFRLRATDQDADFPLVFEITATITPVVRIDNLPCTLYNKVCQANVILTKRLVPGRLHDFAVRVRDTKGDSNSMQATISVTNATTPRDKIFPHIPSLIMVPEDTKPGKELDYLLVRANPWSGKPVYIELWQPKELFTIRQRQTPSQTRGVITLIGELDFETQSMYTLTMYATDPYTEPGKDTRNIAGLSVVVIVQDVQDVPPIFTLAPPLTRINNSVQPGDIIVRVHAEDGDKGVPREIVYGLVSEGNPFTPFFNISETSGEISLARPLEELTQITHVGAPVVLTVVAEEIRRSREESPAQASVVDVGFLLGEPGNSPPYFESDNYVTTINENLEPGTVINFGEQYVTRVKDEDIGKAGVFALKLENNNGTFEINPTVAERTADFVITVRDNTLIDYELNKVLSFKIIAQEVGPATNLSASVPVTIFLNDVNDNPPVFDEESYEVTLSENVTAGSRVTQVHATDKDTGIYASIRYTNITGDGSEAFTLDPDTGVITVAMGQSLDREITARILLSVEARDEAGNGNKGTVPLTVNLLDVNDNAPIFEKDVYEFTLNADLTNFTSPAFIKAIDADAEPPNNVVRYEIVHGNYENKFYLNETTGELILRSPITKIRRKKQTPENRLFKIAEREFSRNLRNISNDKFKVNNRTSKNKSSTGTQNRMNGEMMVEVLKRRRKRAAPETLYTLTARAYDLGVPHLSSLTKIRIVSGVAMESRIMMFVVPGEKPDSAKTAETLAAITGGRVTVLETRPYMQQNQTGSAGTFPESGKKSIVVARVEQTGASTSLVDVEKIREALAANGVGIIGGTDTMINATIQMNDTGIVINGTPRANVNDDQIVINNTFATVHNEEVTVYKAENKLLLWLLIILGLLMLAAIAALIICCICPGCPFYMAPRKRRIHSSETLIARTDGRPKRHLHRPAAVPFEITWNGRKQAWSADPARRNWQFNKRNVKNCSLPGDVNYASGQTNVHFNVDTQKWRDGTLYDHSRRSKINEQERLFMEDVEGPKVRGYETSEMDSLQRHEIERGSDLHRQIYRQRYMDVDMHEEPTMREQHFYREGNAEVLRLVTRGQAEDDTSQIAHSHPHHRSTTLIVDGKDIILQRFIEDQNSRHEMTMPDIEAPRSMESHQRSKTFQPQQSEIILVPERLDLGRRQHVEEIGPNVQRLVIDHGDYESQKMDKESLIRENLMKQKQETVAADSPDPEITLNLAKEQVQTGATPYPLHDLELARQNVLLTRLLLERENYPARTGLGVDSTSYLETQSLPGQVAIATQTDRTAATQTERHVRSRSDNDDSDEESRHRKKLKTRKKYGDGDWRRSRTVLTKTPIEEEGGVCFDKRLSFLRKKVKEVKDGGKVSLEPDVLREISDSLDENESSGKGGNDDMTRRYRKSTEETSISYKILNEKQNDSQSSGETRKEVEQKSYEDTMDERRTKISESTSSTEMKVQSDKRSREKVAEKSPRKDTKSKSSKKSESMIKPSFKILEKEFTILTKKLSTLRDKKHRESTGSDGASQEKTLSKESKKEFEPRDSKKVHVSSTSKQVAKTASKVDQSDKRKEAAILKTKQKLKYQQSQVMSTGSSEYDDTLDKPKKLSKDRQESVKPKASITSRRYLKIKRASKDDHGDVKQQGSEFRVEDVEKRKADHAKAESKSEKVDKGRLSTRAAKLATISRRHLSKETSSSTEEKKDTQKTSSTDFSGGDSCDFQRKPEGTGTTKEIVQRFTDDFLDEPNAESAERTDSTENEVNMNKLKGEKDITEKDLNNVVRLDTTKLQDLREPHKALEIPKNRIEEIAMEISEKYRNLKTTTDDSVSHPDLKKDRKDNGSILTEKQISHDTIKPAEIQMIDRIIESIKEKESMKNMEVKEKSTDTENAKENEYENIRRNGKPDKFINGSKESVTQSISKELKSPSEDNKVLQDSINKIESKSEYELERQKEETENFKEVKPLKDHKEAKEHKIEPDKVLEIAVPSDISHQIKVIQDMENLNEEKQDKSPKTVLPTEQSKDRQNLSEKIEEPIEKLEKTDIAQIHKENLVQDKSGPLNTNKTDGKKDKHETEKEKQLEDIKLQDSPTIQKVIVEQNKEIEEVTINVDKQTAAGQSIELPEKSEHPIKVKADDQKIEQIPSSNEQKAAQHIVKDDKMSSTETVIDHKIIGETIIRDIAKETTEDKVISNEIENIVHKISQIPTEDGQSIEKVNKNDGHADGKLTSIDKEELNDKKEEVAIDNSDDNLSRKQDIALNKERNLDKIESFVENKEEAIERRHISSHTSDATTSTTISDNKKNASLSLSERIMSAEQASPDERKIDKDKNTSSDKDSIILSDDNKEGVSIEDNVSIVTIIEQENNTEIEREEISTEIKKNGDEKKHIKDKQKPDKLKATEKEIISETQNYDNAQTIEETIADTIKNGKGNIVTEKEDNIPIIRTQHSLKDDPSNISQDERKFIKIESNEPHISVTKKHEFKPINKSQMSTPTTDSPNTKTKETMGEETSDKKNIFSEALKTVHTLVDKITNGKKSDVSEIESKTAEHKKRKDSADEISTKEVPPLSDSKDDNNKDKTSKHVQQLGLQIAAETLAFLKHESDVAELEQGPEKNKTVETIEQDNLIRSVRTIEPPNLTDKTEKSAQKNVATLLHEEDSNKEIEKIHTHTSEEETLKKSPDEQVIKESLKDDSPGKKALDEAKDSTYIQKKLPDKMSDTSSDFDKTVNIQNANDVSVETINKKEESNIEDDISRLSSETLTKEKFESDAITSEIPLDFVKTSESEGQLIPLNEQTETQKAEKSVSDEVSASKEDEVGSPKKSQFRAQPSYEDSNEQGILKKGMEETVPLDEDAMEKDKELEPVEVRYLDVSSPIFSSIIDTVYASDDSNSSSDLSRKTTLTTKPYHTPRHRAREISEEANVWETEKDDEEEALMTDLPDSKKVEPFREDEVFENVKSISGKQSLQTKQLHPMGEQFPSTSESTDVKSIQTAKKMEAKTNGDHLSGVKNFRDEKLSTEKKYRSKTSHESGPSSTAKIPKTETSKATNQKQRELKKERVPSRSKKKHSSEESSSEKVILSRDTSQTRRSTRKKYSEDQLKQSVSDRTRDEKKIAGESKTKLSVLKTNDKKDKKSSSGSEKHGTPPKTGEVAPVKAQPKYMAWYKKNREEMEKKRAELMATDDEEQLPRWLRRSMRNQRLEKEGKTASSQKTEDIASRTRRKVKPLINVESEQLKAIVRQGRKLRKAEGGKDEDPPVQIFATTPPQVPPKHHLVQHSEYKYEKIPVPFYLHSPRAPHPSPQLSPEHYDVDPMTQCRHTTDEFDSNVTVPLQGVNRLRHQQLLEKKSVFDIAYSEAAPSQLRSESTTPPT